MKDVIEISSSLLKKWQGRLQLNDWDIQISFVDTEKMKEVVGADVEGSVLYEIYKQTATIHILDSVSDVRYEEIIVHELLHIVFGWETRHYANILTSTFDEDNALLISDFRKDYMERIIHQITSALLRERL